MRIFTALITSPSLALELKILCVFGIPDTVVLPTVIPYIVFAILRRSTLAAVRADAIVADPEPELVPVTVILPSTYRLPFITSAAVGKVPAISAILPIVIILGPAFVPCVTARDTEPLDELSVHVIFAALGLVSDRPDKGPTEIDAPPPDALNDPPLLTSKLSLIPSVL